MRNAYFFLLLGACGAAANIESGESDARPSFLSAEPPSFSGVVFPDFLAAEYALTFDVATKRANAQTRIVLSLAESGRIAFDAPAPSLVKLDGVATRATEVTPPGGETRFYAVNAVAGPGEHLLEISTTIDRGVSFVDGGVLSGFFMSDLSDRAFLERYLPTSFEWDVYEMRLDVTVNATQPHVVKTNAVTEDSGPNHWALRTPAYYSASSLFFHLMPLASQRSVEVAHVTPAGVQIPIHVYARGTTDVSGMLADARRYLDQLEADFGAWPHGRLLIYATAAGGGMEYMGATSTERSALLHELTHSYYARGVGPRDGNAGWIDEAVASWYSSNPPTPHQSSTREDGLLIGKSPYVRETVGDGYYHGAHFLAYLNYRFELQPCLARLASERMFQRIDNTLFRDALAACAGLDLTDDFDASVFGAHGNKLQPPPGNSLHPALTDELLEQLL